MSGQTYRNCDNQLVAIPFFRVTRLAIEPNRTKPGNHVFVSLDNGSKELFYSPEAERLFGDYQMWLGSH